MIKSADFAGKNSDRQRAHSAKQTTGIRRSPGYGNSFVQSSKKSFQPIQYSAQQSYTQQPVQLQTPPPSMATGMTRTQFEHTVKQRFGVQKVSTGTFQDQLNIVTRNSLPPSGDLKQSTWQAWEPGSISLVYEYIIKGFDEFAAGLGGLPSVQNINFFDLCYEQENAPVTTTNPAGAVTVKNPDVGADYSGGSLNIYKMATQADVKLPAGRSSGKQKASLPNATPEQSIKRIMAHELGHGLQEAALTPDANGKVLDKNMIDNYGQTIGWTSSGLYDMRETSGAVKQAIKDGKIPPAVFKITTGNWSDPTWMEQPISKYMVKVSAFEDFGEAVMAYVHDPKLLKDRSPLRYKFLDTHKSLWLPNLIQPKP